MKAIDRFKLGHLRVPALPRAAVMAWLTGRQDVPLATARLARSLASRLARLGIVCAMLFAGQLAHAGVTCVSGYSLGGPFYIPVPASATIPPDLPVGSLIGGYTASVGNSTAATCTAAFSSPLVMSAESTISGGVVMAIGSTSYTMYPTGVSGLGVVLRFTGYLDGTTSYGSEVSLTGTNIYVTAASNSFGSVYSKTVGGMVRALFVKTGPIAAGSYTLSSARIMDYKVTTDSDNYHSQLYFAATPFVVTAPTCTAADVTVPMGNNNSVTGFKGAGSRLGNQSFAIALTCQAGSNSITYSLSPNNGALGPTTNGVARLTTTSSATGVGIRIANPGTDTPVTFATNNTYSGYSGTAGSYTIPLSASYVQTGSSVTPGSANAGVVFTLTYQ
ncbi:MAG: fimbrial protein [Rhodanobacter sp.]